MAFCGSILIWPYCFLGFTEYRIVRRQNLGPGQFRYSVAQIKEDVPAFLDLSGASGEKDPLKEIQRVNFKVDSSAGVITGIVSNEDCVVRKN